MDKRPQTGSRLKIIDTASPHFSKNGKVEDIRTTPGTILNLGRIGTIIYIDVRLDGTDNIVTFSNLEHRLECQIEILI